MLSLAVATLLAPQQQAPLAERAASAALQVCEPFLAGRLTKPEAADAAVALGLKRLSRADADFVFLMTGDVAVAMSGERDSRDCSVSVEKVPLAAVTVPLRAAAARAKWPEVAEDAPSRLWLTPSHLMAAIDETYGKPDTVIAIRFQKRGLPPQVAGKPADPLGLAMDQICIPYARRVTGADHARDLAIAGGFAANGTAFAGYGLALSFAEAAGTRRCTVTLPAGTPPRLAGWQGPGRSVRLDGPRLVVASLPGK